MIVLPCPFDGADPKVVHVETLRWVIECTKCRLCLPIDADTFFTSKEAAVEAWNKRVLPLEIKDLLEEALAMLEIYYVPNKDGSTPTIDRIKALLQI